MNESPSQPSILLSRSSNLSRAQLREFLERWSAESSEASEISFSCQFVESLGDRQKDVSLLDGAAPDDFFTGVLDQALLSGQADWALHSAKDLPRMLADGLKLWALIAPKNLEQTDSLVSRENWSWEQLPQGARIGTSSPSRKQQALELRPDLEIVSLRGTIEERIAYLESGELDAVIVASCALERLEHLRHLGLNAGSVLPFAVHPLQGYLAVVGRESLASRAAGPALELILEPIARRLRQLDARQNWGTVALIGAGAGAPGLLTLEGQRLLQQADVIYYDALVGKELLDFAPRAEKIYVGKRKADCSISQDEISRQLWRTARQGKQVVRLKGGDALLFARAAEELQALDEALVPYRVLPGISAAFAAAASLALPLTQRGDDGSSLHLLSAYPPERIDFRYLPPHGNIIFYMGLSQRREIRRRALEAGRQPGDSVLVILWASLPQQKNINTTLGQLPEIEIEKNAAGLIMLGPIARPQRIAQGTVKGTQTKSAASLPDLPDLQGKTWITGLNPSMDAQTPPERVWHLPLLELRAREGVEAKLLQELQNCDILLFTSKHAVRYFFACLEQSFASRQADFRLLGGKNIVSIGKVTTRELEKFGLCLCEARDWESPEESSKGLLQEFACRAQTQAPNQDRPTYTGKRILIPSSSKALPALTEGLPLAQNGGHSVVRVVLYDNLIPESLSQPGSPLALLNRENAKNAENAEQNFRALWSHLQKLQAVYLSSPSTAEYFAKLVAEPLQQRFGAGFPGFWEFRCKGELTRQRLAELQAQYGILQAPNDSASSLESGPENKAQKQIKAQDV